MRTRGRPSLVFLKASAGSHRRDSDTECVQKLFFLDILWLMAGSLPWGKGPAASRAAETRTYHRHAQSHFECPIIWKSYGEVKSPRYCFSLFHSAFRTLGVELFLACDNSACSRMNLRYSNGQSQGECCYAGLSATLKIFSTETSQHSTPTDLLVLDALVETLPSGLNIPEPISGTFENEDWLQSVL